MSLRTGLVLAAAYLLIVIVVALVVPLGLTTERRIASEFESGVLGNAAILASRSSDIVASARRTQRAQQRTRLARVVQQTARDVNARIVVTDAQGRVLTDSSRRASAGTLYATDQRPEFAAALFEGRIDSRHRFSETLDEELLLVTVPVVDRGTVVGAVRVSKQMEAVQASARRSWFGLGVIGVGVIAAGLLLAWFLATNLARPVRRLQEASTRLGKGDLQSRAEEEGPKEVSTLARSFNQMAVALADNLNAQRDFVANASHQLRTPLTGLKLRLEAIKEQGGPAAHEAHKAEMELDRLSGLVDDLLELARALSVHSTGSPLDLSRVAQQAVERWTDRAAKAQKRLHLDIESRRTVWADPSDLAHVLDNLIENAIRYCPVGADITVQVTTNDGRPVLLVSDTGPGIPEEDRGRVFDRFYRGAQGRRSGPGTGLGLAIVAELVRRWGGEVRLLDGAGTRIEAAFPPSPTAS